MMHTLPVLVLVWYSTFRQQARLLVYCSVRCFCSAIDSECIHRFDPLSRARDSSKRLDRTSRRPTLQGLFVCGIAIHILINISFAMRAARTEQVYLAQRFD